ncbi:M23 family metallopeptidase [Micromonospora sp. WMMD1102]|uniref:murein hydrolase activator EnvC family protein n=1 Tax=Micromonospora sp. WMMD1102 TaxID=3016105 RepID=UPI0024157798|nr:M23 family metallopeptidase [Micromonospora sp. WMMD1102]MDG4785588.1 M23 family metallopeptidase [Micromonospora sp. WMMD1102]
MVMAPIAAASLARAGSTPELSRRSMPVLQPAARRFRWPLDGTPPVVRRFDPPPQPWAAGHRGVDLAAPPGAAVRAAGPGVVFFAGTVAGRPLVSVAHAGGLRTTYEPVRPGLAAGQPVRAGDPLGVLLSGHPGCPGAGSACLHWGLRRGDEYLDPLLLLGLGRVRLLPLAGSLPVPWSGRTSAAPGHAAESIRKAR